MLPMLPETLPRRLKGKIKDVLDVKSMLKALENLGVTKYMQF